MKPALLARAGRDGMTMIELLVGLVIFSFAMLPILNFGTTTTRATYITGKHLLASHLAASILDRILALPFAESFAEAKKLAAGGAIKVAEDDHLRALVGNQALSDQADVLRGDLQKEFRFFEFTVGLKTDPPGTDPRNMFLVTVLVTWRVDEGQESSRLGMILEGVKFDENQ